MTAQIIQFAPRRRPKTAIEDAMDCVQTSAQRVFGQQVAADRARQMAVVLLKMERRQADRWPAE